MQNVLQLVSVKKILTESMEQIWREGIRKGTFNLLQRINIFKALGKCHHLSRLTDPNESLPHNHLFIQKSFFNI